jgi:hypothetical protein
MEIVVLNLFFSDGLLKVGEHFGDGVQGATSLELGLDLGEQSHYTSLGAEVKLHTQEVGHAGLHLGGLGCGDEEHEEYGNRFHFFSLFCFF